MEGVHPAKGSRILASASSQGHHFQIIESSDGQLSIAIDSTDAVTYRWQPDQIESCMNLYLGMLRHRALSH